MAAPSLARRVPAIPTADADELRPAWIRTTIVRLGLAVLLLLVLAAALVAARRLEPTKASFVPTGTSGVIVVDVSQSVTDPVFRRIQNTLRMMSEGGDSVGLVAFSDVPYELLPPGSRPRELRPLLRYFRGREVKDAELGSRVIFPRSPWSAEFSAGTRISGGLKLAEKTLERERIERGSVVLVSDLNTAPSDKSALSQVVADVKSKGVELRVVPLLAYPEDLAFFKRLVGEENVITPPQLAARNRRAAEPTLLGADPAGLALLGGLVLALLALNEWWGARVDVPGSRA